MWLKRLTTLATDRSWRRATWQVNTSTGAINQQCFSPQCCNYNKPLLPLLWAWSFSFFICERMFILSAGVSTYEVNLVFCMFGVYWNTQQHLTLTYKSALICELLTFLYLIIWHVYHLVILQPHLFLVVLYLCKQATNQKIWVMQNT